jgi:AbrB family looped-hinge helix DNA binding protein
MLVKLTRGNQLTIPKSIIKKMGLKVGQDYLDVRYENGIIYLVPVEVEEKIPQDILEKFRKKVLKKEKEDVVLNEEEAEGFLEKYSKK